LSEIVEITLDVVDSPQANPAADEACDEGNGTATFDLTALEATVNGGTANPVNWFEDDNASLPISSPYTTGSTTVYAVVGDGACLSKTVEINLYLSDIGQAKPTACE